MTELIAQKKDAFSNSEIKLQGDVYRAYHDGVKQADKNAFLLRQAIDMLAEGRDNEAITMLEIVENNLDETSLKDSEHDALAQFDRMKDHNIALKAGGQE